jgi:hypothetical protein
MSNPPEETGTESWVRIGEPVHAGGRTIVPVVGGQTRRIASILTETIRLQGLIVMEGDSWYALLLPEGTTPEEFLAATPGLRELVERIRTSS